MTGKKIAELMGVLVRKHRKRAELTQAELARYAGIGKTAVFDLEKGKATLRLSTLLAILPVLNLKLDLKGPFGNLHEEG